MERHLAFEQDGELFRQEWLAREEELSRRIEKARNLVDKVQYSSRDLLAIAGLTASMNVEGHRSDLVILKAARAHAAFEGRATINEIDIALAAELALPHRMKSDGMQQVPMGVDQLQERIDNLIGSQVESADGSREGNTSADEDGSKKA